MKTTLIILSVLVSLAMTLDYQIACDDEKEQEETMVAMVYTCSTDSECGCIDDCLGTE